MLGKDEVLKEIRGRKAIAEAVRDCKDIIIERREPTDEDRKIYAVLCATERMLTPIPAEIEGGGYNWFTVCGECHGVIDPKDGFCKHCGVEISWNEK